MKVLSNRAFVKRGEGFTLKFGQGNDLPPLVFTKVLKHPFIILQIVSTSYPQECRYKMTRWLDCQNVKRFRTAKITYLGKGDMETVILPDSSDSKLYSVLDDGKIVYFYVGKVQDIPEGYPIYGLRDNVVDNSFTVGTVVTDLIESDFIPNNPIPIPGCFGRTKNGVVFKIGGQYEDGEIIGYYIEGIESIPMKEGRVEYNFNFKVNFDSEETSKMIDKEYTVNLFLVDGQSTKELLKEICSKYNIFVDNIGDMFRALQNINAPELNDIDVSAPLSALTMNIPLYQFKLYVEE